MFMIGTEQMCAHTLCTKKKLDNYWDTHDYEDMYSSEIEIVQTTHVNQTYNQYYSLMKFQSPCGTALTLTRCVNGTWDINILRQQYLEIDSF